MYLRRMLKTVEIEGFRGFEKVTIDVAKTTAIVGRNSSGKSSVLQAVRLACEALLLALESDDFSGATNASTIEVCSKLVVSDPSRLSALVEWIQLFTHDLGPSKTTCKFTLTFDPEDVIRALQVTLVRGRNTRLLLDVSVVSDTVTKKASAFKAKQRTAMLRDELLRERPTAVLIPAFNGVVSHEERRSQAIVNRLLGGGDQSHIVRNLVARLDLSGLNRLNGFLARTLGAQIVKHTTLDQAEGVESLRVVFKDTNGDLELSAAGTGLIAMVALYASLETVREQRLRTAPNSVAPIFLLDEPEAHLHPRLQGDVGTELLRLAEEFNFQIILATHSVEMINRFGKARTKLLNVDRAQNRVVELSDDHGLMRAIEDFADLEPFTAVNMLASRRLYFHEGPSDDKFLNACARVLFRSDDVRMRAWKRFVGCTLGGSGNAPAAKAFELALSPQLFPRLAGDPVVAALILDRDYVRAPTLRPRTASTSVRVIECVWSRHSIESLFLDAQVLAGWIAGQAEVDETTMRKAIERVLPSVDEHAELNAFATRERTVFWRRPDANDQQLSEKAAQKKASDEVRAAPEVFQQGHGRAGQLLQALRKQPEGKRLRGKLLDMIERADPDKLGDGVVPAEIRELLVAMVG
jgi:hypothetical protein